MCHILLPMEKVKIFHDSSDGGVGCTFVNVEENTRRDKHRIPSSPDQHLTAPLPNRGRRVECWDEEWDVRAKRSDTPHTKHS